MQAPDEEGTNRDAHGSAHQVSIQVLSDIHLELRQAKAEPPLPPVLAPVLALVGDIGAPRLDSYRRLLESTSRAYEDVFVIAGNHEYYHSRTTHHAIAASLQNLCSAFDNVHFLDNESHTVDGVRFIGSTLWSYVPKGDERLVESSINDYKRVQRPTYDFKSGTMRTSHATVSYTNRLHEAAVHFIEGELARDSETPTVILTHHAPSFRSVHAEYEGSPLNSAYATDLERIATRAPVIAWFHGHMHRAARYTLGERGVLVACNPMGYPGEANTGYDPAFVARLAL
jgi:predicted phosphodiesterase